MANVIMSLYMAVPPTAVILSNLQHFVLFWGRFVPVVEVY